MRSLPELLGGRQAENKSGLRVIEATSLGDFMRKVRSENVTVVVGSIETVDQEGGMRHVDRFGVYTGITSEGQQLRYREYHDSLPNYSIGIGGPGIFRLGQLDVTRQEVMVVASLITVNQRLKHIQEAIAVETILTLDGKPMPDAQKILMYEVARGIGLDPHRPVPSTVGRKIASGSLRQAVIDNISG